MLGFFSDFGGWVGVAVWRAGLCVRVAVNADGEFPEAQSVSALVIPYSVRQRCRRQRPGSFVRRCWQDWLDFLPRASSGGKKAPEEKGRDAATVWLRRT